MASQTLPHSFTTPQISRSGVLTLHGFGIRITMQAGHLQVEDGIGHERRRLRLPRVNHRLKRLVCIGDDGFVTLAALRWLSDVGSSFLMLDRLGKVRVVTGPASPSEARLRRAQALALENGLAVKIARELISAKLKGQEVVVREKLKNIRTADSIADLRERVVDTADLNAIRGIESRAAAEYWEAWRDLPILFPRNDASRTPSFSTHRRSQTFSQPSKQSSQLHERSRLGRLAARSPEARAKHVASRRQHAQACSAWDPSTQPAWLTARFYTDEIQPRLVRLSGVTIASRIGVSRWYAGQIRKGYRPHPRHWQALGDLVGVSRDSPRESN